MDQQQNSDGGADRDVALAQAGAQAHLDSRFRGNDECVLDSRFRGNDMVICHS
ncbi:MAG: hypothetical protein RLZZ273_1733 [Bacteroidota bacterium]|jgi:hypothetical protein